jgi:hypothetical protein
MCVEHWEIITDNLKKAGWSFGSVSALDCEGRTIWLADARRDDGKRLRAIALAGWPAFCETRLVAKKDENTCAARFSASRTAL